MRKQRGISLAELMVAVVMMGFVLFSTLSLLISGLLSYARTTADQSNAQPTAQVMQKIMETIRPAMSVSVANNGNTLNYTLPKVSTNTDPVTGEKEYVTPLTSDGVTRSFVISGGNLVQNPGGRILLRGISTTDPDPRSSLYNQNYLPFTITTMSTRQAVTINLILSTHVPMQTRFAKSKTTVALENIR
jgi:Tfp pilus assembly protein PilV